jgi:hypothetical protein
MTSPDGTTWTAQTSPIAAWFSITYGNQLFVAVSNSGANRIMTSTNGIDWFRAASYCGVVLSIHGDGWHSIAFGSGKFVAVSNFESNMTVMVGTP